tara:strand:+ start:2124 stop:2837 length:714 start_codon:yes stop_codon:yes gene_type:complete
VLFCTFIQSFFGVGILVFGTPILLSLGYGYFEVLGILCPSSLGVSLAQIILMRRGGAFPKISDINQSILGVVLGTALLSIFAVPIFIYFLTAVVMFFAGTLRLSKKIRHSVLKTIGFKSQYFYFFNAVFHGFSNLGGVLLVFKNSISISKKQEMLFNIACIYALYVTFQVIVLTISGNSKWFLEGLLIVPFSIFLNVFLGQNSFCLLSPKMLDAALGVFFISVGGVLIYKVVGLVIG